MWWIESQSRGTPRKKRFRGWIDLSQIWELFWMSQGIFLSSGISLVIEATSAIEDKFNIRRHHQWHTSGFITECLSADSKILPFRIIRYSIVITSYHRSRCESTSSRVTGSIPHLPHPSSPPPPPILHILPNHISSSREPSFAPQFECQGSEGIFCFVGVEDEVGHGLCWWFSWLYFETLRTQKWRVFQPGHAASCTWHSARCTRPTFWILRGF